MSEIVSGAIVRLKSGGPIMTVQRIIGSDDQWGDADFQLTQTLKAKDGDVCCQWFQKDSLKDGIFPQESLNVESDLG